MTGGGGGAPQSPRRVRREAESNQVALENAGKFSGDHSGFAGGALSSAIFMDLVVFGTAVVLVERREERQGVEL